MRTQRRTNFIPALVLVAVSLALVFNELGLIPAGLFDLIARGWPVLLVFVGLMLLLRDRVPLSSVIALILSVAVVGGIAAAAFSNRAGEMRSENEVTDDQPIGEDIAFLEVNVTVLSTDVRFETATSRTISTRFNGSTESDIETTYVTVEEDSRATYTLVESQPGQFPMLEAIGRGTLIVQIPANIAVTVAFAGDEGAAEFDMGGLALERLSFTLRNGNALVTLPAYQPLSPNIADQPGNLLVQNGNITLIVPDDVGMRLEMNRAGSGIDPVFPANAYNYLVGDVLETRDYDDADIQLRYIITAPRGLIQIQAAGQ